MIKQILWTIWTETPAAADRYDASRRALLRDALAGERSADVVARLRDRVDGHARAGTPREDADDEDVEERAGLV